MNYHDIIHMSYYHINNLIKIQYFKMNRNGSSSKRQRSNFSTPNKSNNKTTAASNNQNDLNNYGSMNKYNKLIIFKLVEIFTNRLKTVITKLKKESHKTKLNKPTAVKLIFLIIKRKRQVHMKIAWGRLINNYMNAQKRLSQKLAINITKRRHMKIGLMMLNKTFQNYFRKQLHRIYKQNKNHTKCKVGLQNLCSLIITKNSKIKRQSFSKIIKSNISKVNSAKYSVKQIKNIIRYKLRNNFNKILLFSYRDAVNKGINTQRKGQAKKKNEISRSNRKQIEQKRVGIVEKMQTQIEQKRQQVAELESEYEEEILRNNNLVIMVENSKDINEDDNNYFVFLSNIYEYVKQNKHQQFINKSLLIQRYRIEEAIQSPIQILEQNANLKQQVQNIQNFICGYNSFESNINKNRQGKQDQFKQLQEQNMSLRAIVQSYIEKNYILNFSQIRKIYTSLLQKIQDPQ